MSLDQLMKDCREGLLIRTRNYQATCDVRVVTDLSNPMLPPRVGQCKPPWGEKELHIDTRRTFCEVGCLVCSLYSLAVWSGYTDSLLRFRDRVYRAGAFVGAYLRHPTRVIRAWRRLHWHTRPTLVRGESSLLNWRHSPADTDLLSGLLRRFPVVVEVDFNPHTLTLDQHFVLAIKYTPQALSGDTEDDLLVMDPYTGSYTSVLTYFNPQWLRDGSMAIDVTKVQRTLTGARVWEVV